MQNVTFLIHFTICKTKISSYLKYFDNFSDFLWDDLVRSGTHTSGGKSLGICDLRFYNLLSDWANMVWFILILVLKISNQGLGLLWEDLVRSGTCMLDGQALGTVWGWWCLVWHFMTHLGHQLRFYNLTSGQADMAWLTLIMVPVFKIILTHKGISV